jgi:hypothetical protein
MQNTFRIAMRFPHFFCFNSETAVNNVFQNHDEAQSVSEINRIAKEEFVNAVKTLKDVGIDVHLIEDDSCTSPDALFLNNWFSTHHSGLLITYPMFAANRRTEVAPSLLPEIENYDHLDLESFCAEESFLEGTGSMVMDHDSKIIYAGISERTHLKLLYLVAERLDYKLVSFETEANGLPVYHTNVIMHVGSNYVCIALDLIVEKDRPLVERAILNSGKKRITLTKTQAMYSFCGNMIQLINSSEQKVLVLSTSAFEALNSYQLDQLKQHNDILLPISIPTIERIGGGSIRCMIAELF